MDQTVIPDDPKLPSAQTGKRHLAFGLRTLFFAVVLVAGALALILQHQEVRDLRSLLAAHGLSADRAELSVDRFSIQVTKLAASSGLANYQIVIETLGPRPITVASEHARSQINGGTTGTPPVLTRADIVIFADLFEMPDQSTNQLRAMIRPGNLSGAAAGGPSTYSVPHGKTLDNLFELLLTGGIYERGRPLPLCRVNGETSYLTVH